MPPRATVDRNSSIVVARDCSCTRYKNQDTAQPSSHVHVTSSHPPPSLVFHRRKVHDFTNCAHHAGPNSWQHYHHNLRQWQHRPSRGLLGHTLCRLHCWEQSVSYDPSQTTLERDSKQYFVRARMSTSRPQPRRA